MSAELPIIPNLKSTTVCNIVTAEPTIQGGDGGQVKVHREVIPWF